MQENPIELEDQITRFKLLKGKLQKETKKLSLESGLKLETVARLQERRHALAMEAKERGDTFQKLTQDLQEKVSKENRNRKLFIPEDLMSPSPDTEEKEKVKEKFMTLIDRKINTVASQYLKKYLTEAYNVKTEDQIVMNEDDIYTKSQRVWSIMVVLEEEGDALVNQDERQDNNTEDGRDWLLEQNEKIQYYTTFRIGQNTSFSQLKEEAARFWNKNPQHFDLYDEKGEFIAIGKKDQKIEKYFKFRLQDLNQLVIVMKLNEKIKEMRSMNSNGIQKIDMEERPKKILDDYEKYQKHFPKLKKYIKLDKEEVTEREAGLKKMNNPKGCGENNICIVLILSLMLAFTIVATLQNRGEKVVQLQNMDFRRLMDLDTFMTINRLSDFLDFLINDVVDFFPLEIDPNPSGTEVSENVFQLYRPIVLRQYRVREKPDCPAFLTQLNYSCYYSEYSTSTMSTDDYGEYEFQHILLPHNLQGNVKGLYGEYTPSAYNIVFDPSVYNASQFVAEACSLFITTQSVKDYCRARLETLCQGNCPGLVASLDEQFGPNSTKVGFVDSSTKAISFEVVMMDRSHNDLFYLQPRLEFAPSGIPIPTTGRIVRFRPTLKGDPDLSVSESLISGFMITLAVLLLLFIIYNLFVGGNGKLNINYFFTLPGFLNLIIIALVFYIQRLLDKFNNYEADINSINNITDYPTTQDIAETYESIFLVRGCLVGLLILRLTLTLELNTKFKMLTTTYESGMISAIPLLIIFLGVLFALCGTAYYTYGAVDIEFGDYQSCIYSLILIAIGFENGWLKQLTFARGFFICLCVNVLYFLMMGVLASVFVETYRRVSLDHGLDYYKKYRWGFYDYVNWMFSWVPRKLKLKKNQLKSLWENLDKINLKKIKMHSWLKSKLKKSRKGNGRQQQENLQVASQ